MSSLGGYPAGTQYDPDAPWNQSDPVNQKVRVKVSLVLEKKFEILVPSYPEGDPKDPDWTFDQEELEASVHEQVLMPQDAWKKAEQIVAGLPGGFHKSDVEDLKGWEVMDEEIETV